MGRRWGRRSGLRRGGDTRGHQRDPLPRRRGNGAGGRRSPYTGSRTLRGLRGHRLRRLGCWSPGGYGSSSGLHVGSRGGRRRDRMVDGGGGLGGSRGSRGQGGAGSRSHCRGAGNGRRRQRSGLGPRLRLSSRGCQAQEPQGVQPRGEEKERHGGASGHLLHVTQLIEPVPELAQSVHENNLNRAIRSSPHGSRRCRVLPAASPRGQAPPDHRHRSPSAIRPWAPAGPPT